MSYVHSKSSSGTLCYRVICPCSQRRWPYDDKYTGIFIDESLSESLRNSNAWHSCEKRREAEEEKRDLGRID